MTEVTLVSYGAGNIASIRFALERLGSSVHITSDPAEVAAAERLILPGVGAAAYAMTRLEGLGLVEPLRAFSRPLLGICLGQQLLFQSSEEGEDTELLSLIPGRVRRLDPGSNLPVPHMGWSRLSLERPDPLLHAVPQGAYAYFVHAFVCPEGPATLACADYGGSIPAVVRRGNRWGCQFHPERSGGTGARILRNFLEMAA